MKRWMLTGTLLSVLVLAACSAKTDSPTGTGNNLQLVTQILSPICEKTLKEHFQMPEAAVNAGIDEKAVCDCGLSKTETKLSSDPARILKILSDEDAQVKFLTEVASECAGELAQKAIKDSINNALNPAGSSSGSSGSSGGASQGLS